MTRLSALAAALLAGASLLQAEQPRVREGNEKLRAGDADGALERYQAAEQEAGPHPEIDFDRGDALQAAGRGAEAVEAWKRAVERDQAGALASRALQNTGNALDAAGDKAGAVSAFSEALRRDPANEDARYNLEVLLRRKSAPQARSGEAGDQGKQGQQQPSQAGAGQQAPEQQAPPSRADAKNEERRARDEGQKQAGQHGQTEAGAPKQPGATPELDKQDALRLLDALRARERNMPLEPAVRKDARRRDVEKDW